MTKEERDKLGLTKPLTYRYTLASGDIYTKGDDSNTPFLRALARVGIWTLGKPNDNEKYFTPESIMALRDNASKNISTNFKYPVYISDFEAPLEYKIKKLVSTGGPIYNDRDEIIGKYEDVYEEEIIRQAENKLSPPGTQLGLLGAGQPIQDTAEEVTTEDPTVNTLEDEKNKDADATPVTTEEEKEQNTNTASSIELLNSLRGLEVKNGKTVKIKGAFAILDIKNDPKINSDGTIDVDGNVSINPTNKKAKAKLFENGKMLIKFGNVTGDFSAKNLKTELSSLSGFPKTVGGTLDISESDISSLSGCPQEVKRFICQNNKKLTSLAGGPKKIKGYADSQSSAKVTIYDVSGCSLSTLDGNGITEFGPGGFDCSNNKLTNLSGLSVVSTAGVTEFNCSKNSITSLVGAPKIIKDPKSGKPGNYDISNNPDITSLPNIFADFEVDDFKANGLKLTSLSFAPKKVFGNFECKGNKDVKVTNQTIGKDRFKVGGGFEEDATNRVVAIDGSLITDAGTWQDKTYTITTVYKKPADAIDSTNFVPSTGNTTPPQYKGNALSSVVKSGGLWYQETSLISALAHWDKIKPYTPSTKKQYSERVLSFTNGYDKVTKTGGDGIARVERGTSGAGGIQYQFQRSFFNNVRSWINWSMMEETPMGWGEGQPTGATIINGKNYGAKTASRKYTPVMYWLKGDPHPKVAISKEIFVAKIVNPPHAQNAESQASFINNITICLPAANQAFPKRQYVGGDSDGAFVAQVRNGSGQISYFAGGSRGFNFSAMKKVIEGQGKTIMFYQNADPGGSFWVKIAGEEHPKNVSRGAGYPMNIQW